MELKSSVAETLKLICLGTLVGWLFILHFRESSSVYNLNIISATKNLWSFTNTLKPSNITISAPVESNALPKERQIQSIKNKKCNMFNGRWVYKPDQISSYDPLKCPFLKDKTNCRKHGRPDLTYERWSWEANDCDIPLLNGTYMAERLRNKRVIFVGDSLNRNMWESLTCILYSSIPLSGAVVQNKALEAKDYNFSVEYYPSPFLTEYNINYNGSGKKVLSLDKISSDSNSWLGADIMVFNSGHWWAQTGSYQRWDLLEYEGKLIDDMPLDQAYERGMRVWQTWIEENVDPIKTTVFFRSYSPEHKDGQQLCYNKTQPLREESYIQSYPISFVHAIERIVKEMSKLKVTYLDITKMSEKRIDAHPSIFRFKNWKDIPESFTNSLGAYAYHPDCCHWCMPGVPDTWNRLLYASLFFNNNLEN